MRTWIISTILVAVVGSASWSVEAIWVSGAADEADHWYGLVVDVVTLPDGRVVVVDELNQEITLLAHDGSVISTLGRPGRGPGEFEQPKDADVRGSDGVLVLDIRVGRISSLAVTSHGLTYEDSWTPPLNVLSFCTFGDRIITLARGGPSTEPGIILHELEWGSSKVNKSFGIPRDAALTRPQIALTAGRIACLEQYDLIIFLPDHYPEVHAFRGDGQYAWTASLPDYAAVQIESGPGWVRYSADEGYHDTGAALAWRNDKLIVQWAQVGQAARRDEEARSVRTAVFSLPNGKLMEQRSDLPRLVVGDQIGLVGYTNVPYPRVIRYREVDR